MKKKTAKKAAKKTAKKRPRKVAKKAARKVGRPTDFKEKYCELAKNYCLLGAKDTELAEFFGVSVATINVWKKKHPEFVESIAEGKDRADARVAQSLFQKALGYSHVDTKFATHEGRISDEKEYIKHHAPDTTAAMFWLKNRQPDKWRDKIDHNVEFEGDIHIKLGGNVDD